MNSLIESQFRMTMDKLSNYEDISVPELEQYIEEAGEQLKAALRKQTTRESEDFRLRCSNVGRPECQLISEKEGKPREKMPYNHIFRMMYGDCTEILVEFLAKVAGINITGGKSEAHLDIGNVEIKGEDDIEIDGKVFDTKSSSPWAYENKWTGGWDDLSKDDAFGYTAQLLAYSKGTGKPMGGWIVVNKSTGELKVVEANPTPAQIKKLDQQITTTVTNVSADNAKLVKGFEPSTEYFRRVPTGSKRLHTTCTFCSYKMQCWPNAVYKPQTGSKAQNPRYYWYSEYAGEDGTKPIKMAMGGADE